jgi:CheY-like chemotaxis protein
VPTLRILLAEDNPGDVFLVKEALSRHSIDHTLTVASDGQRAWERIEAAEEERAKVFDLFLLDLNLPVRPGLELLARIRGSRTKISRAPIVIVTSSNSIHDRAAAERAGADRYFCKPSNLEEFMELGCIVRELWTARLHRPKRKNGRTKGSGPRREKS